MFGTRETAAILMFGTLFYGALADMSLFNGSGSLSIVIGDFVVLLRADLVGVIFRGTAGEFFWVVTY